MPGQLKVAF